jgi:hypothetical protein
VTESVIDGLSSALVAAANEVRGIPAITAEQVLATLPPGLVEGLAALGPLDSDTAWAILGQVGIGGGELPDTLAPLLALISALPAPLTERLLTELLARLVEPR